MVELKYFKQGPKKSIWEADQRLKKVISDGGFVYEEKQHKEWFIAIFLPYLRGPLGQPKIDSQEEALEIAMKLEVVPRWFSTK